jgi:hypothetical protein
MLSRIPLTELTMLGSVFIVLPLWFFHISPSQEPIIDPELLGVMKIIKTGNGETILENKYGVRAMVPWQFNQNYVGKEWTLQQNPRFYSLHHEYKDGERYFYDR